MISFLSLSFLMTSGCQLVKWISGSEDGNAPSILARDMFNPDNPDRRRYAIAKLASASWGGEAAYVKAYRELVLDPDPTVVVAAIGALSLHGSPTEDAPLMIARLTDSNKMTRSAAARGLQRLHNPAAVTPLIDTVQKEIEPAIRSAAVVALGQYRQPQVVQVLIGLLSDADYTVVRDTIQTLQQMTGQAYGYDSAQWLQWAKGKSADELFAGGQPYYYPHWQSDDSFWPDLRFWQADEKNQSQRQPKGQSTDNNSGASPLPAN